MDRRLILIIAVLLMLIAMKLGGLLMGASLSADYCCMMIK